MLETCMHCVFFHLESGQPNWSEVTPGSKFDMGCKKEKWNFDSEDTSAEDFRKCLHTAEGCPLFKHYKYYKMCEYCYGGGKLYWENNAKCTECNGTGIIKLDNHY